jgi:hypothetical protein
MDLEESEAGNDCAAEDQQQFNRQTEMRYLRSREKSDGIQSCQAAKYGPESRGTANQGSLCWRELKAI